MENRGQFIISIDLEMSWGSVHRGAPHDDRPYRMERQVVADVLGAFDEHGISATWAIVGHLFLGECSPTNGVKHPEVARPGYQWLEGDWYDLDPCSSIEDAPTWYGVDLVEAIRSCPTPQEIGSHAFGHLIAGDPGCSEEAFRSDIEACHRTAREAGIELQSFVYPRNSIGHLDALQDCGFIAYRGGMPERFPRAPRWTRKSLGALDRIRPLRAAAVHPELRGAMANIPQTHMFNPESKVAQRFGTSIWAASILRRLNHAVSSKSLFHLWFHTHNLATKPERARAGLDSVLAGARRHIDAGCLENVTMGELATRMLSHG